MQIRAVVAVALCAWELWATGCGSEDGPSAALPPITHPDRRDSGTAPPPPPPPPPMDAATGHDGGAFDLDSGQLRAECEEVVPVPFIGEDTIGGEYANAIAMPSDLLASRIVATWAGTCEPAAVKIEMSDGDCPDGDGHALTFLLDALAIVEGRLGTGIHELTPDSAGGPIRVRYVRPVRREPVGEWGTCEGVIGTLNVSGELGTTRLDQLQAQFEMQLAPCDDSGLANQTIQGTFNVTLRRSLEDVCPP